MHGSDNQASASKSNFPDAPAIFFTSRLQNCGDLYWRSVTYFVEDAGSQRWFAGSCPQNKIVSRYNEQRSPGRVLQPAQDRCQQRRGCRFPPYALAQSHESFRFSMLFAVEESKPRSSKMFPLLLTHSLMVCSLVLFMTPVLLKLRGEFEQF